jgi:phage N-6-adenine-methyltransferase
MFSSQKQDWDTRIEYFEKWDKHYHFDIDVCATKENSKCKKYFTPEQDALKQTWQGMCYMNPPYDIKLQPLFIRKAFTEALTGNCEVLALLPSRTDTKVFHEFMYKKRNVQIEFIKGRLIFGSDAYWQWLWEQEFVEDSKGKMKKNSLYKKYGKMNPAPFPSMLVLFFNQLKLF